MEETGKEEIRRRIERQPEGASFEAPKQVDSLCQLRCIPGARPAVDYKETELD